MISTAESELVDVHELHLDGLTYAVGVERGDEGYCGCWACEACDVVAQESNGAPTLKAAANRARMKLVAHHTLFHLSHLARLSDESHA